jgi:hypothetical protein
MVACCLLDACDLPGAGEERERELLGWLVLGSSGTCISDFFMLVELFAVRRRDGAKESTSKGAFLHFFKPAFLHFFKPEFALLPI